MSKNRNALAAGLFMLISAALVIAVVIGIEGTGYFKPHTTSLIKFNMADNISGLRPSDDVRLGGLKVGEVGWIEYVPKGQKGENKPQLSAAAEEDEIIVAISTEYKLTDAAKVGIEAGLTGAVNVNISDIGAGADLPEGVPIDGHPNALSVLMASLADMGPKINDDLDDVKTFLDIYKKVGTRASDDFHGLSIDIHSRLAQVSDAAQRPLDDVHAWLGPSTGDFHVSMANVRNVTAQFKDNTPELIGSAKQFLSTLNTTMNRIEGMMDGIGSTVTDVSASAADLREILEQNRGRIDEIVASVKSAMDYARVFTEEIASNPSAVLFGPDDHQKLYNAAREFADGAGRLSDAASDLRAALSEKQPDPVRVQKLYDNLAEQFEKFRTAEDALWKQVR